MRFCYADPPYPGMSRLYKGHPDYAGEVDHAALIARLQDEFPDGWALSTASTTLQAVLRLCPDGVRILAWLKPHPNIRPGTGHLLKAWEPVILYGGRHIRKGEGAVLYDYVVHTAMCLPTEMPFVGRKPEAFCFWLFRCLGALPGDELADLFPGSGAVGRAWDKYQRQISLPLDRPREKQEKLPLGVV